MYNKVPDNQVMSQYTSMTLPIPGRKRTPLRVCISDKSTNITHVTRRRVREFSPSCTLERSIYHTDGQLAYGIGEEVNPLSIVNFDHPIIFVDGLDQKQVMWALTRCLEKPYKLVFIGVAVLKQLRRQHIKYFMDKEGVLPDAFKIERVPSVVTQIGSKFKIEEVCL